MSVADVVDLLACPTCAGRGWGDEPLRLDGPTLRCAQGHAYDVARQGHVNLLGRAAPRNADTAEMVAARERFLGSGAYDAVADALADTAVRHSTGAAAVLDVGAGPGFYLDRVLAGLVARSGPERSARGLALDVSPAAARRAARSPWPVGAVVADAWGVLPVRSGSVDVVLSVFAPRHPPELARVLRPGGVALVVSPLAEHLAGLRAAWGLLDVEPGKQERLASTFGEHLVPVGDTDVRYSVAVDRARVDDLVAMGPNAFHRGPGADGTAPTQVDVAVRVAAWRRPG
ncbi:23S rRNA m(1)G-748 methyltransferase [Microlunatus sagamiharensis]|uniref:23S rRNA m(1)G-748 methyltransferase n=1 Tax=Microlunatus sagamiharensis TaxID=546874 RepID=A0A1H2MKC8_9ACTN|nr:methyltransferase domain-containing protein [Microlunatus sagamiharensis]SDU93582.1 23S rRNA m(1)G-748 methyltransferase [Microlunatus sagamiharensis]